MKRVAESCRAIGLGTVDRILRSLRFDLSQRKVLLVFDEAQHLSIECLETLGNYWINRRTVGYCSPASTSWRQSLYTSPEEAKCEHATNEDIFDLAIDLTYLPMQEVLKYLRDNGYKTFIATGREMRPTAFQDPKAFPVTNPARCPRSRLRARVDESPPRLITSELPIARAGR